jgi:hypothetical protein
MTRVWLVLICLALVVLAVAGMWFGWRSRARRQAGLPPLPAVPQDTGAAVLPPAEGVYVGTTFAQHWQDRVVHGGLGPRSAASMTLSDKGILLDRDGAQPLFVPAADVVGARLAPGLAGKVVGSGGLLVLTWRLGDTELDTGFRADDKTSYPDWVRTINNAVGAR